MIFQQFDYTVASFPSINEVVPAEVSQADLVIIEEQIVQAGIYHPRFMRWVSNLEGYTSAYDILRSSRERKSVKKAKQQFMELGYRFEVKRIDEQGLEEFLQLYEETTMKKDRANRPNMDIKVRMYLKVDVPVYVIGMYKDDQIESALLCMQVDDVMEKPLGAKKRFQHIPGGAGGVLEVEFLQFCIDQDIRKVDLLADTNPKGIFSPAGVFEFKARYGYTAFPANYWRTTFILNKKIALSDLVFLTLDDNQLCQLVISDSDDNFTAKYSTKKIPKVLHRTFQEEIENNKSFFGL